MLTSPEEWIATGKKSHERVSEAFKFTIVESCWTKCLIPSERVWAMSICWRLPLWWHPSVVCAGLCVECAPR